MTTSGSAGSRRLFAKKASRTGSPELTGAFGVPVLAFVAPACFADAVQDGFLPEGLGGIEKQVCPVDVTRIAAAERGGSVRRVCSAALASAGVPDAFPDEPAVGFLVEPLAWAAGWPVA